MQRTLLTVAFALFASNQVFAAPCPDELQRHIGAITADISQKLVNDDFLGGRDIEHQVESCLFEEADNSFDIDLRIKWRGALMKWNEYEIWGRLLSNFDATEATFTPVGANDKVQSLRFWGNVGSIGISIVQN